MNNVFSQKLYSAILKVFEFLTLDECYLFRTCRSRRVGSFQRKQLRKEKKALKTPLYCDRFDCRHATTLWKDVFRSKVVARKLKSLRPTSP